jgi:hypothetical protein
MTVGFETKQKLPVGHFFDLWSARPEGRLQISFEQIVGLAHVAVHIDNADPVLGHCNFQRDRRLSCCVSILL